MKMTNKQIKTYNQQFEAEMAEMSVDECRRWNPHMSEVEATHRISQAKTSIVKNSTGHPGQQALF